MAHSWKEKENRPDAPCVAVCSLAFEDVCRGCGRTVEEVRDWNSMTQAEKDAIWTRILGDGFPKRQG